MTHKIFVIEDQPAIRAAYRRIIARDGDLYLCGEAASANEALHMLPNTDPDVVLLDLSLPGLSGLEMLKIIKSRYPKLPVIIVSGQDAVMYVAHTIALGASGYVEKLDLARVLGVAVRRVIQGALYISENARDLPIRTDGADSDGQDR